MATTNTHIARLSGRQKVIGVITLIVFVIIIWQVIGLFRHGGHTAVSTPTASAKNENMNMNAPGQPNQNPNMQAAASVPEPTQTTLKMQPVANEQADFVKLQQEVQDKYISALNELQMLKLTQQIAETNKDIAAAKLATVKAEKSLVDLLSKPTETTQAYSQKLAKPMEEVQGTGYIVLSVSQLMNKWRAVIGYNNKLYNVSNGDILPPDQSTVVAVNKDGVVLEKDGIRKRLSLVPMI